MKTPANKHRHIALEDFFKNPQKANYQLSPDGNYISYTAPWESRMNIFFMPAAGGEAHRITSVKDRDISSYFWKGSAHILYAKDNGGDENFHLYSVHIHALTEKDLTPFEETTVSVIDDLPENDEEIIIAMNERNKEFFDPYLLNVRTGSLKMLAENPGNITGWLTDHNGQIRVATTTDGVSNTLLYRQNDTDSFRHILTTSFKESLAPLFFTFDNKNLYAISNLGRDKAAAVIIDPETGKELEMIYEHPRYDTESLSYSHERKVLTQINITTWKPEEVILDPKWAAIKATLIPRFEEQEVYLSSHDREEKRFIVRNYSDRSLGSYFLYDAETDRLTHLADRNPWINAGEMCRMEPVHYTSRDGIEIEGYLTLPLTGPSQKIPVVINPHGGPWARDVWGFNPEVQFLANRGYAVLQMNFRGSTGYGRHHWELSFKQWGLRMQDDITDGVEWLIAQGIADPERVAIYGGSYGGYATLAGMTFTPHLYACGVDYVGVSNLFTFMKTIPPYWKPYLEMMYEMVGNPDTDRELLEATSPVFHVDKIKAPLFIAQGAKDPRVNKAESDQIVDALKVSGIEVPYMVKDNEGHGFSNEENRFAFYLAMEEFLGRHLG